MDWTTALNQLRETNRKYRTTDIETWHIEADTIVLELLHSFTRNLPDGNELADAQVFVGMYEEIPEMGWYA